MNHTSTLNSSEYSLRNRSNNPKPSQKQFLHPVSNNLSSYKPNQRIMRNITPRQQKLIPSFLPSTRNTSPFPNNPPLNSFTDSHITFYQKPPPLQTAPFHYTDDKIEPIFQRDSTYEPNSKIDVAKLKANFGLLTEKIDKLKSIVSDHKPFHYKQQKILPNHPYKKEIKMNNTALHFKQIQIKSPDALRYRTMNRGNMNYKERKGGLNKNNITLDNLGYNGGFKQYKKLLPKNGTNGTNGYMNMRRSNLDSSNEVKSFHISNTNKVYRKGENDKKNKGVNNNYKIKSSLYNDKDNTYTHDKEMNTSINLSDIADDLVHTFEIESNNNIIDDIKGESINDNDELLTTNEINLMISQNNKQNNNNNNKIPKKENALNEKKQLTINKFSVNISHDVKENASLKEDNISHTDNNNEIDNEDDMLIMEIMKKVEEENNNKYSKNKHVAFDLNENILIQYNDKNNITSLDIIKEKTKEKVKFVQHKMNLYNKILKSTNKPKGIIKPFNEKDIKKDFSFVPEDFSDEDDDIDEEGESEDNDEEEEESKKDVNKKNGNGDLVKNIRKMFDDDEEEGDD